MRVSSKEFQDQGALPQKSVSKALGGQDIAPVLEFDGVPVEAKSLALTCYDPDAPTGSGFWHWIVVNIPASEAGMLSPDALPAGALVVVNDAGAEAFNGALPPPGHGPHRYVFTLHALGLDTIDAGSMPQAYTRFTVMTNELARATITATFENKGEAA